MLTASFADLCTLDTSVTAVANYLSAVYTGFTVVAEVSVASNTFLAGVTSAAYFGISAGRTFFLTVGADNRTFLASRAAVADHYAFSAGVAAITPSAAFTAILAYITLRAEIIITVVAVLTTF